MECCAPHIPPRVLNLRKRPMNISRLGLKWKVWTNWRMMGGMYLRQIIPLAALTASG